MMPIGKSSRGFFKIFFRPRFLMVSLANYVFGNLVFAILWTLNNLTFPYFIVAIITTTFASVFSFQTQSRFLLESRSVRVAVSPIYLAIQFFALAVGSVLVPYVSHLMSIGYITIQFVWSALISILSVFVIYASELRAKLRGGSSI